MILSVCIFFFFKQKTAYEMRISDWSSDVCSSDLGLCRSYAAAQRGRAVGNDDYRPQFDPDNDHWPGATRMERHPDAGVGRDDKIGRASCRERVCKYV